MPAKKLEEDNKVMDVSKPGKGRIITTSRPVVAPIASTEPKPAEDTSATTPVKEEIKPLAPSASHKVIKPLSTIEVTDASESETIKVITSTSTDTEPATEAAEPEPTTAEAPSPETATPPPAKEETSKSPEPEPTEEKPAEETTASTSSDAAGVEALAGAAEAKKLASKEAEEQAKRDAAVQELIDSKKYFVPIGQESKQAKAGHRHHEWLMVTIVILLAAFAAGYLLTDAGVINPGFDVPVELIKN